MHNAELWTHRAPICLLMRWCKDFSPCIKDWTKTQIWAKSKVLFKLCVICVCYICPFYQTVWSSIYGRYMRWVWTRRKGDDAGPRWATSSKARLDLDIPPHQGLTLSFHNTTKEPKISFCSEFCQNEEISLTRALQSDLLNQDCTSIVVWREGSFCGDNKDDQKLFWKVTHKYILLGSNLNQNDSH